MNRVVLIGNGFDLAHNLPTKYENFINWYWKQRILGLQNEKKSISTDNLTTLIVNEDVITWDNAYHQLDRFPSNWKDKLERIKSDTDYFRIKKTPFFERICTSIETKGWVDIENEYYYFLIEIDDRNRYDYDVKK